MNMRQRKIKGFTLLEILLVLAISSSLIVLMLNYTTQKSDEARRDKAVLQMQQILNAGLSYYVNTSTWPISGSCPQASASSALTSSSVLVPNYLPNQGNYNNPYGNTYNYNCVTQPGAFYVYTQTNNITNAQIIAGRLPMAFITTQAQAQSASAPIQAAACKVASPPATCNYVVAYVNIPGQNLNNARSVNYAGTFSSSGCVPQPSCPPGMTPQIFVMPAGVSGVNDAPTCGAATSPYTPASSNCSATFYPVSSFVAYAVDSPLNAGPGTPNSPNTGPYDCDTQASPRKQMPCLGSQTSDVFDTAKGANQATTTGLTSSVNYWRVCLAIVTSKGRVTIGSGSGHTAEWGKMTGSIVAFTRCAPNNGTESPASSGYNVWQNNNGFTPNQ